MSESTINEAIVRHEALRCAQERADRDKTTSVVWVHRTANRTALSGNWVYWVRGETDDKPHKDAEQVAIVHPT